MLKKTVTYEDFDGNTRTEDLYFNLTQTEATEFALELPDRVTSSITENDTDEQIATKFVEQIGGKGVFEFIKKLVLKSYGVKSLDGRRFIKKPELAEEFSQTLAYDQFIMDLMQNEEAAAEFVNAVIPASLAEKVQTMRTNNAQIQPPQQ